MEQALSHVPVIVGMLAYLPLEETLRNVAGLGRLWHFAALQPGALARQLRLRGESKDETMPPGLQKLLDCGCLKDVEKVEIAEPCTWCPDVLSKLPALRSLHVNGPGMNLDWALSCILSVADKLWSLEVCSGGLRCLEVGGTWPKTPALRTLSVRQMPLSLWDLPRLFAAHDLETLELQACPLTESQMGIVHCGAKVQPKEITMIDCGGKMALTLLLSLSLSRLVYLCVDVKTDEKLQEELSKACRPNLGGVDPEMDAAAALQAQAERELRMELRRAAQRFGAEAQLGPWKPLSRWLQAAERHRGKHGEVQYRMK